MRLRPRPGQPRVVFAAVRLLCFGALAELGLLVTVIATHASVQATVARVAPASVQSSGLHILADEVLAPVAIAAWLLLARGISRRSDSARAALAAFFGLTTLSMLAVLAAGAPMYATADFAAGASVWFICLVSMVLILTPASNRYFRPETAALASPAG
jgi:apolipoprotein N-acyltransferase